MRLLTNLFFKVTLSSMVLTAPAMITGHANYDGDGLLRDKRVILPFYSSAVIEKFIDHPSLTARPAFKTEEEHTSYRFSPMQEAGHQTAVSIGEAILTTTAALTSADANNMIASAAGANKVLTPVASARTVTEEKEMTDNGVATIAAAKAAELRMVINQAVLIYDHMDLEKQGLDEKAFEYAWRGYHNLLKKGRIHKRTVLSICDFSQSCCSKRMYVIDVLHRKLLYRTYVAHGQNSGEEYANTFSNEPESFKSSLGFYVTDRIYYGRNGLSLRLNGVDSGYNDMASKRKIVLHGSTYVGDRYMQNYGTLGTSLGCPALPSAVSGRIIRAVKNGSCLFIYHPTQQYLDNSPIING